MFQIVLVDNSGYESEIVAALPHQYAAAEAGRADRDVIELHKPSDRFASWEVWSTDRIAGRDGGSPVAPSDDVRQSIADLAIAYITEPGENTDRVSQLYHELEAAVRHMQAVDARSSGLAREVAQHQRALRDRIRPKAHRAQGA